MTTLDYSRIARTHLDHPDYILSPISTLVYSTEHPTTLTAHDILDAYSTLYTRLRLCCEMLSQPQATISQLQAFEALKAAATPMCTALLRDMQREDFRSFPSVSNNGKITATGLRRLAVDSASVSNRALQICSMLFRFPVLSACFPDQAMEKLMDCALNLVLLLNSKKIIAYAVIILATQQLPGKLLEPRKAHIATLLQKVVLGGYEGAEESAMMLDAYTATYRLITAYPITFYDQLTNDVLPTLLSHLTCSVSNIRERAIACLSGFALARLDTPTLHANVGLKVFNFLQKQLSRTNTQSSSSQLSAILTDATMPVAEPAQNVLRALSLTGSIVVLLGDRFFQSRRIINLVRDTLRRAMVAPDGYRRPVGNITAMQAGVWRCIIYAFAQLRSALLHRSRADRATVEEQVFPILKEELDGGVPYALIAVLLGADARDSIEEVASTKADISRVVSVLHDMVHSSMRYLVPEGRSILIHLLGGIVDPTPMDKSLGGATAKWEPSRAVPRSLFQEQIWDASYNGGQKMLPSLDWIRTLEETEVAHEWHSLVEIWFTCAMRDLRRTKMVSVDLFRGWQALLLVKTHLTQSCEHLTASPSFTSDVVQIVARFINPPQQPPNRTQSSSYAPGRPHAVESQRLDVALQLWRVMHNVFARPWLADAATSLVASILEQPFTLDNEPVVESWGVLLADLIVRGRARLPRRLGHLGSQNRLLWSTVGRRWLVMTEELWTWRELADFLILLWGVAKPSDEERELWSLLVRLSLARAEQERGISLDVFEFVLGGIGTAEHSARLFLDLLQLFVDVQARGLLEALPIKLLEAVGDHATRMYSKDPTRAHGCLELMSSLYELLGLIPSCLVLQSLCILRSSLQLWIRDEQEAITQSEYIAVIVPLYEISLQALLVAQPPLEQLDVIAPFITAVVGRPNGSTAELDTFLKFCERMYKSTRPSASTRPRLLRDCWKACTHALVPNGHTQGPNESTIDVFPSISFSDSIIMSSSDVSSSSPLRPSRKLDVNTSSPSTILSLDPATSSSATPRDMTPRVLVQLDDVPSPGEDELALSRAYGLYPTSPAWTTGPATLHSMAETIPKPEELKSALGKRRRLPEDDETRLPPRRPLPENSTPGMRKGLRSQAQVLRQTQDEDDYSGWEDTIKPDDVAFVANSLRAHDQQEFTNSQGPRFEDHTDSFHLDLLSPFQLLPQNGSEQAVTDTVIEHPRSCRPQRPLQGASHPPDFLRLLESAREGFLAEDPSRIDLEHLKRALELLDEFGGILRERVP